MKFSKLACVAGLCLLGTAIAKTPCHPDVTAFIKNADACEHMAGEWDSDLSKTEQKRIERSIVKYCGTAKKQLHTLKAEYKGNQEVQKILSQHAYESVTEFAE